MLILNKIVAASTLMSELSEGITQTHNELQLREASASAKEEHLETWNAILGAREISLVIYRKELDEREKAVKNREDVVNGLLVISANRKATIETMKESQKELNDKRVAAESDTRVERQKRQTAEKALQTCMTDKDRLDELLALAQQALDSYHQVQCANVG